jgi:hypothetical protein
MNDIDYDELIAEMTEWIREEYEEMMREEMQR